MSKLFSPDVAVAAVDAFSRETVDASLMPVVTTAFALIHARLVQHTAYITLNHEVISQEILHQTEF